MFGDLLNTPDQQKTTNYWDSEDKRPYNVDKNYIFPSPQINQTSPRFEGEQSSSQRDNNQEKQHNNTSINPSSAIQPKVTRSHQELRKDLQVVQHQSSAPSTSIDENQHKTFTSNEPSSVPKSQESVQEPPYNPEIPDEAWSHPNDTILRPSSPAESSQSDTDSCISTSTPKCDPQHDDNQEDCEQLNQEEPGTLTGPIGTKVVPYDKIMTGWDEVPQFVDHK